MKYNFTETIPLELISYKKILDTISTAEETEMMPCAEINRDKRGRIISANFYLPSTIIVMIDWLAEIFLIKIT